jgi:hypothetical protein
LSPARVTKGLPEAGELNFQDEAAYRAWAAGIMRGVPR